MNGLRVCLSVNVLGVRKSQETDRGMRKAGKGGQERIIRLKEKQRQKWREWARVGRRHSDAELS